MQLMMSNTRSSRVVVSFSIWLTGGDGYLCDFKSELWSHDRIHTQALSTDRTGENGDVKRMPVIVFNAHELEYRSCKISWGC